jgi:hypothetical protein
MPFTRASTIKTRVRTSENRGLVMASVGLIDNLIWLKKCNNVFESIDN